MRDTFRERNGKVEPVLKSLSIIGPYLEGNFVEGMYDIYALP